MSPDIRRSATGRKGRALAQIEELPSRRARVTDLLRASIVAGELEPGRVYSAPSLGAELGVSATPVREAMIDLVTEGLVEVVRNKGYRVKEPAEKDLLEVFELRQLLEPPMVTRIAERGVDEKALGRLEKLAETTVRLAEQRNLTGHVAADIAFHQALIELGGNDLLLEILGGLRHRARLFGLGSMEKSDVLISSSEEHLELLRMMRSGDSAGAGELMRRHIRHSIVDWGRPGGE